MTLLAGERKERRGRGRAREGEEGATSCLKNQFAPHSQDLTSHSENVFRLQETAAKCGSKVIVTLGSNNQSSLAGKQQGYDSKAAFMEPAETQMLRALTQYLFVTTGRDFPLGSLKQPYSKSEHLWDIVRECLSLSLSSPLDWKESFNLIKIS